MKIRRTLLAAGTVALLGYGACRGLGSSPTETQSDPKLILNRSWIERDPKSPKDEVHLFVVVSEQAKGIFFKGSSFAGKFEIFDFERKDDEIRLVFPQSEKKARFKYKISSCKEVEGFDLCLDLSENPWGGPKRYIGSTDQDGTPAAARAHEKALPRL